MDRGVGADAAAVVRAAAGLARALIAALDLHRAGHTLDGPIGQSDRSRHPGTIARPGPRASAYLTRRSACQVR